MYEVTESNNGLAISFSSSMDHIDRACGEVARLLESRGKRFVLHFFAVNLVMREGLTNAVRHGNKNDPEKVVVFELHIGRNLLRIRISDQGRGFDWGKKKAVSLSKASDHGRGMAIMEQYFTRHSYNARGNVLYLEKQIPPINSSQAAGDFLPEQRGKKN